MFFYQVFLLSPLTCTVTHCRNCKRLREFEEIEILRQSCRGYFQWQGGFRPRIRLNSASGETTTQGRFIHWTENPKKRVRDTSVMDGVLCHPGTRPEDLRRGDLGPKGGLEAGFNCGLTVGVGGPGSLCPKRNFTLKY